MINIFIYFVSIIRNNHRFLEVLFILEHGVLLWLCL